MTISINGSSVNQDVGSSDSFTSYAVKTFETNDANFEFRVRTADRELIADVTVGMGLAKLAIAQFLHAQSQMFKGMEFRMLPQGDGKSGARTFRIQAGGPNP